MTADLSLDALLGALREAGLRIGVGEVTRLHRVFELQPTLRGDTRRRLKAVLRAVVVKSLDDDDVLDRVCDNWLDRQEVGAELPLGPAWSPSGVPVAASWSRSRRLWAFVLATIGLLLAVATTVWLSRTPPAAPPPPASQPAAPQVARVASAEDVGEMRRKSFPDAFEVRLNVATKTVWGGWHFAMVALLALSAAGGYWWTFGQRTGLPVPAPIPERKGPPRVLPATPRRPALLDARQRDALVWGIGHYLSDEPAPRLDLPETVRRTARGAGLIDLCFHLARHQREVWLWVDEEADDPTLPFLADEAATTLAAYGLPVEVAAFRGVPDELAAADGSLFAPQEVDERRDSAAVAILTDGRVLTRQYDADDRAVFVDSLLRGLSHWPRLAFVDFSGGRTGLRSVLDRHELLSVGPEELGGFLVSGTARTAPDEVPRADPLWAAACCLSPAPIDESTALELRRRLRLSVTPYTLGPLRREARGSPGRLQWPVPDRVRYLNWLGAIETPSRGAVVPRSVLGRSLDFWEEIYDEEIRRRSEADSDWAEKPAAEHLLMERALLVLWRRPGEAARELYRLYRGPLQEEIRRHLGLLVPQGRGTAEQIRLPWSWDDLDDDPAARVMLLTMELGGEMPAEKLRRPGRVLLGVGMALGIALGALALAWREPLDFQEDDLEIVIPSADRPPLEKTDRDGPHV